jgi:Spx/MgsR family transcriptional regulator
MIIYGIKNCDTVKKALQWLDGKKITYEFHDYKSKGITPEKLKEWCKQVGWETLVNKKGMTWRQLSDGDKANVTSEASAILLMGEKTSVIKRPLIEEGSKVLSIGFDAEVFARLYPK